MPGKSLDPGTITTIQLIAAVRLLCNSAVVMNNLSETLAGHSKTSSPYRKSMSQHILWSKSKHEPEIQQAVMPFSLSLLKGVFWRASHIMSIFHVF